MPRELLLAAFIVAFGLCVAAASTHLYQGVARQQAMIRYDGKTFLGTLGHLALSFICGPYIMLQLGWQGEDQRDGPSFVSVLLTALVAFGWAFISGLMLLGFYVSIVI